MTKKKTPIMIPEAGWAVYLRTSDADAQNPRASQERQRRSVTERLAGTLPLIEEYVDNDSGRNVLRKNYQRLLADARLGKFSPCGSGVSRSVRTQ